ncbi:MAG: 4a-hydroxytetrahydrobiopterin dehydratase [Proteobacteria bacterium]|nr:4a-hydroxytetrahydrobiopterin dehydratase [Desulfobacula sp.]MBU4132524.1 4a-hydroxytetrahydrobiopterin dehydratase [Pseudomonadota bacterium]
MKNLITQKCIPCEKGAPALTDAELAELKPQIPGWEIIEANGIKKLRKAFKFKNFEQALVFTNKVGELSEAQFHHPTIILDWGRVEVIWVTHKIRGLHLNDVAMAVQTDSLAV